MSGTRAPSLILNDLYAHGHPKYLAEALHCLYGQMPENTSEFSIAFGTSFRASLSLWTRGTEHRYVAWISNGAWEFTAEGSSASHAFSRLMEKIIGRIYTNQ